MKIAITTFDKANIDLAITSPSSVFDTPDEVVAAALPRETKVEILKRWALDARALQIATEENMSGGERPMLDEVNEALTIVDPQGNALAGFEKSPSKI